MSHDVGSWLAVGRIRKTNEQGNVISGNVVAVETRNAIIQGKEKLIAAVGLKDIVVVDTDDAILICDKDSCGDVKMVLEKLRNNNKSQYL